MNAIDLFCGCGGLSLGFMKAGYIIKKAVEFDQPIANTYKLNHPEVEVIVDDIRNIDTTGVFKNGDADIIIGGPPCQGFSMAGARIRQGFIDDPRNYLFKHYYNVVKEVRPKVFVMENVKGMKTMQNGKIFKEILGTFSDAETMEGNPYHLYYKVIKALDFGIPQKRERLIIIGTLISDIDFDTLWEDTKQEIQKEYSDYFSPVTVWDAIGNLPKVTHDGLIESPSSMTSYQRYLSGNKSIITNHTQSNHSAKVIERMQQIGNGQNYTQLHETINSVHSGAYGRLCWDEAAPTITTRFDTPAGGRFTHPVENRTLSPREAARIQSFPDDFVFYGAKREISRQIGNAVPPKISYFLARLIEKILEKS
ncbi:DNA cytosine methyltransferase [Aminipila sp.]|uniref:DNA cytosine methyltransferase n=1 Tax=Aminipila sp. TaxID=2060095 RepID=UPI00289919CA|nr:DNA cytosine methyltransferase [Aminipila sp.]